MVYMKIVNSLLFTQGPLGATGPPGPPGESGQMVSTYTPYCMSFFI